VPLPLLIEPEAEADIDSAFAWYEAQRAGLGSEFLAELALVLESIESNAERYPTLIGRTRRALVRRFPFGVFYIIEPDSVAVTACMHCRRDPRRWQLRR
jgi:toxin ParE1/3/4